MVDCAMTEKKCHCSNIKEETFVSDSYAEVIIKKRMSMMQTFFRVFMVVATVIMSYFSILNIQMYAIIIIVLFVWLTYLFVLLLTLKESQISTVNRRTSKQKRKPKNG